MNKRKIETEASVDASKRVIKTHKIYMPVDFEIKSNELINLKEKDVDLLNLPKLQDSVRGVPSPSKDALMETDHIIKSLNDEIALLGFGKTSMIINDLMTYKVVIGQAVYASGKRGIYVGKGVVLVLSSGKKCILDIEALDVFRMEGVLITPNLTSVNDIIDRLKRTIYVYQLRKFDNITDGCKYDDQFITLGEGIHKRVYMHTKTSIKIINIIIDHMQNFQFGDSNVYKAFRNSIPAWLVATKNLFTDKAGTQDQNELQVNGTNIVTGGDSSKASLYEKIMNQFSKEYPTSSTNLLKVGSYITSGLSIIGYMYSGGSSLFINDVMLGDIICYSYNALLLLALYAGHTLITLEIANAFQSLFDGRFGRIMSIMSETGIHAGEIFPGETLNGCKCTGPSKKGWLPWSKRMCKVDKDACNGKDWDYLN